MENGSRFKDMRKHSTVCHAIFLNEDIEIVKLLLKYGAAQCLCQNCGQRSVLSCVTKCTEYYPHPELFYFLVIHGSDSSLNYSIYTDDDIAEIEKSIGVKPNIEENKICWLNTADIELKKDVIDYHEKNNEVKTDNDKLKLEARRTRKVKALAEFERGISEMRREFLAIWLFFSCPKELCDIIFNYLAWII